MNLSAQICQENSVKKQIAALYARVSSQHQKEEETIDSQVDVLLQFAKENGYEIPKDFVFLDAGYSGASLDRPGLDSIRDIAREGYIDAILVYSPDRLTRRYALQLILEEELRKLNVQLIYFKGGSQNKTAEEAMLTHFQGIFAEYERTQILDRSRRGKLYKARQGDFNILPKAPYGYYKERGPSFYTIKENEAQIVREIFRLFIKERLNLRQICRQLELKSISSPSGCLKWDSKTISEMLRNTAYIGTAYYGKTEKGEGNKDRIVRYKARGKVVRPINAKKKKSKELWMPISVPQIINESDFEVAQELLRKNKEFAGRNTQKPTILQGILVCGVCGKTYYKKGKKNSTSNYYCSSRFKNGPSCKNRRIGQEAFDRLVWENIIELLKNPQLIEQEISRRASENLEKEHIGGRKKELERELKQIEVAKNKLLDAYQESDCLSLNELRKRSKILKEKEKLLKQEIESIEAFFSKKEGFQSVMRTLEMFKKKLDTSFETLTIREKQTVVRALIEDVVIFPEEIEIRHTIPVLEDNEVPLCGAGHQNPCRDYKPQIFVSWL